MIIKIDNREAARYCNAIKQYAKDYKIIIEQIPIGDFIFSQKNKEVVFEFKTLHDFKKSVLSGRIFDQALRQRNNFKYHFIIIDLENHKKEKALFNEKIYYEAIAYLNTFTTVLICPSLNVALNMMEIQAKSCMKNALSDKIVEKTDNVAYNYLILIKGINKFKAKRICDEFNLKTFEDLRKLTTKKLLKVKDIGPITAQKIIKSIKLS